MARLTRRRLSSRSVCASAMTSPARRSTLGGDVGGRAVEQLDEVVGGEPGRPARTAADRDALIAERRPCHQPAFVHVANHIGVRHEDVVEEDFVEMGVAR